MSDQLAAPLGTVPFSPNVFRERREKFMAEIRGGVAVVFADPASGSKKANSDFTYLTGLFQETNAALLLAPDERTHREFLFLSTRDPEIERWEGARLPLGEEIETRTGIGRVRRLNALGRNLAQYAARGSQLHFLDPVAEPDAPIPKVLELYGRV